ncbi:hypothetical protein ACFQV2_25165 [Actinokineospora soli]|uniref:L-amino acid ligase C-terminal domain-containing protein n=1 Tax=Actinokineospora soli TaxID=1048753 RepID=A0ABW2TU00_9PSEU
MRSAAIAFLLPPKAGLVAGITGETGQPGVVDVALKPVGHRAGDPTSNNSYLGHVMAVDHGGPGARALAEAVVGGLAVRYREDVA